MTNINYCLLETSRVGYSLRNEWERKFEYATRIEVSKRTLVDFWAVDFCFLALHYSFRRKRRFINWKLFQVSQIRLIIARCRRIRRRSRYTFRALADSTADYRRSLSAKCWQMVVPSWSGISRIDECPSSSSTGWSATWITPSLFTPVMEKAEVWAASSYKFSRSWKRPKGIRVS